MNASSVHVSCSPVVTLFCACAHGGVTRVRTCTPLYAGLHARPNAWAAAPWYMVRALYYMLKYDVIQLLKIKQFCAGYQANYLELVGRYAQCVLGHIGFSWCITIALSEPFSVVFVGQSAYTRILKLLHYCIGNSCTCISHSGPPMMNAQTDKLNTEQS